MPKRNPNPNAASKRRRGTGVTRPTGPGAKTLDTTPQQQVEAPSSAVDRLVHEIRFASSVRDPRHRHPWDNDRE